MVPVVFQSKVTPIKLHHLKYVLIQHVVKMAGSTMTAVAWKVRLAALMATSFPCVKNRTAVIGTKVPAV